MTEEAREGGHWGLPSFSLFCWEGLTGSGHGVVFILGRGSVQGRALCGAEKGSLLCRPPQARGGGGWREPSIPPSQSGCGSTEGTRLASGMVSGTTSKSASRSVSLLARPRASFPHWAAVEGGTARLAVR